VKRHRQSGRQAPVFPMRAPMHSPVGREKPMVTELAAKREDQNEREEMLQGSASVGPTNDGVPALRATQHGGFPERLARDTVRSRSRTDPALAGGSIAEPPQGLHRGWHASLSFRER
jgi:hypothetical protein